MHKLTEVADINPRLDRERVDDLDEIVSFVPMASVSDTGSIASEESRLVAEVLKGFTPFNDRDILVAKITPCFENGKIAHARIARRLGFGSTEFHVIRARSNKLDDRYLYHFLRQPRIRVQGERRMTGSAGQRRVPKAFLEDLEIPVPRLSEQRRIAAILDKADALRAKNREATAKLDHLTASSFHILCGSSYGPPISIGMPSQADAAKYIPLRDVARMATGHTPDRSIADYWGGDIPWIGLSDIRRLDGRVAMDTAQRTTPSGIANSSAVILPKGTVCFSRTASVGFATVLGREMATSQDFVNWICGDRIEPLYLLEAFRASKKYLVSKSTGSTHKTIYFPVAQRFHVYLPPLGAQAKFSNVLESIWRQEERIVKAQVATDRLFDSLQQAAFTGQL